MASILNKKIDEGERLIDETPLETKVKINLKSLGQNYTNT